MNLKESFVVQNATRINIILWWELRRIVFNVVVGSIGVLSVWAMTAIGSTLVSPGEDFVEPMVTLAGVVFAAVSLNVWYTRGWVTELREHTRSQDISYRRREFRRRLWIASATATLPVWIAFFVWSAHQLPS